jgi:site-specific DNA recombinase
MIKNIAMYLRISREKGEDVDTLQNHRERLTRLCTEKGWQFTLFEEVISGQAKLESREALNDMLNRLEEFDAVVVVAIDRLSRDLEYAIYIFKQIEKAGIPIITPERTYASEEFMFYGFESLMAHHEYRQIKKRMLAGKRDKAMRGEIVTSKPPLGYEAVSNNKRRTYTPNADAETVKQIFEMTTQGYGLTDIAKMFNKSLRGIQIILTNEAYIGTMIYKDIRVENAFPAIIPSDLFYQAKKAVEGRFSGNKEARTLSRGKVRTILKDLMFCYECGRKMGWQISRQKTLILKTCQHCGMGGCTERILLSQLYHQLADLEESFEKQWKKALDSTENTTVKEVTENKISSLNSQKTKLTKRLEGYKDMRADGELSKSEYTEKKDKIESELSDITKEVSELQRELNRMDSDYLIKNYATKMEIIGKLKLLNPRNGQGKGWLPEYSVPQPSFQNLQDKAEANRLLKLIVREVLYKKDAEGYVDITVVPKF